MAIRSVIKKITAPAPVISVCTALLFTLCFLIVKSLSDDASGELQFWITLLGGLGIAILVFFLITNCYSLYRQYRRNEIGSKLTAKIVAIFLFLTVIPFSLIYFFSIQFLNKGVDSWFDVRIEQTVKESLLLSQTALEGIKEEITSDVEEYAKSLRTQILSRELLRTLDDIRELEGYSELSLYTDEGRIHAFSSDESSLFLPDIPGDEVFTELGYNQTYTLLEPVSENTLQFRVVAPVRVNELGRDFGLQAIKILPLRYAALTESVENANSQYAQMVFARGPLKFSLIVTLSLISLASLLFSILTAVYLSRRMVAPISNLAAGTQKIAEGDYGSHLPITASDELGILTKSFNNMSSKINEAQQAALASQTETEQQKGYLEAVLTNLSSGVFSFDQSKRLQICNSAATDILDIDLEKMLGRTTKELIEENQHTEQFFKLIDNGIESEQANWQEEISLLGTHGRQMLILRGTLLQRTRDLFTKEDQADNDSEDNYVIVFDDVTNLIQAQRDAAWGEVARRLAHEIKNPLTPIQLSAERIKNKFSDHVEGELRETLDRSTRTIVQQVESMKEMVNAFSSYAQPVRAKLRPLNINQLVRDVAELHTSTLVNIDLELDLDQSLPEIKANASAMRQVLNNLIINASHALEDVKEGKLRIRTHIAAKITGEYIDLVVEDNGPGIPTDIRESLFDPYVSSKAKGSGLGLAIVKRIVEEHSGSVWTRDSSIGGTAMHIRLPINAMQTYRGNRHQNTLQSSENLEPSSTNDNPSITG